MMCVCLDFLIGYGAFGVIWAVTDPRTSRRVALKKMPNVFQSVVAARRAFREIKMLCTFRHDNVNNEQRNSIQRISFVLV
jgi:nemo like kinase